MAKQGFDAAMAKARKTNAARDVIDRRSGSAAPGDGDPGMLLRTAMTAIASAAQCLPAGDGNLACLAEGLAMLEDLHAKLDPGGKPFRIG
jgi:hypothetical protein